MSSRPPALLLVHGLIGSLRDLVPVFAGLGVRAHAPDLLGYGMLQDVGAERISLAAQVYHLKAWIDAHGLDQVDLVGHSVGGAVGMLFAHAHSDRVASFVSVEGNFSLADAFWSAAVAGMMPVEVDAMLAGFRKDPVGWLARSGIAPEPAFIDAAISLLANQPGSTIQAMARSVVHVTGAPAFEAGARDVFDGPAPVHLVAGARSREGWAVPDWARARAASETVLPGGHMMMVERPQEFAAKIIEILGLTAPRSRG